MSLAIGVDIGGTKIAAGLVSETGDIVESTRHETPATDASEIASRVAELVERLKDKHDGIVGVGVGAAGFIDAGRSTVLFSPNIDWVDEPLAQQIHDQVSLPVVIENDANAAGWGEFRFGAGEDTDDLLLVTVGTGIGGGIVHGGQLFRGAFGVAGEIGHLRVVRDALSVVVGNAAAGSNTRAGTL